MCPTGTFQLLEMYPDRDFPARFKGFRIEAAIADRDVFKVNGQPLSDFDIFGVGTADAVPQHLEQPPVARRCALPAWNKYSAQVIST